MRLVVVLVAALLALGACVKRDAAIEKRPMTDNLAAYWTCAIAFSSDGRGEDANEAFAFVPWFESRVRERGVFEPLGRDEATEAEVVLRVDASTDQDRVVLRVVIVDGKTKEPLGEIEATGAVDALVLADAGDAAEPKRLVALRSAADRILDHLREKRRVAMNAARRAPPPSQPAQELPVAPVGGSAVCSTQCHSPAASASSHEEQYRVAAGIDPLMRGLRECLDRVGGQLIDPAVLLRFAPDGRLRHVRVDVGGYENLECIQEQRARPIRAQTTRATLLVCEYRCTTS